MPPVEVTKHGYAFLGEASEDGDSAGRERREASLAWDEAGKCLPPPPANGIVVCALSERYPHVVKFEKKKWAPFEAVAGKMIEGVSVSVSRVVTTAWGTCVSCVFFLCVFLHVFFVCVFV